MISTYIISLGNESKRRENIINQCNQIKISPIIINAVDARSYTDIQLQEQSQLPQNKPSKKTRWLTKGELGCALSHHKIYQEMIDKNIPYAFILEDDAKFIQDPKILLEIENLEKIQQQHYFDVLILGFVKVLENQLPFYYRRYPLKMMAALDNFKFGLPWKQYGCGMVGYIISLEGAKKLLEITEKPCVPADDFPYFEQECNLVTLHCRPAIVLEDLENLVSTIRVEKLNFLKIKFSSLVIRSIKGWIKFILMNYFNIRRSK